MTYNEMLANAYGNSSKNESFKIQNNEQKIIKDAKPIFQSINEHPELNAAIDILKNGGLVKVTQKSNDSPKDDSIYRRVAKFLVLIGSDEAAKILPRLTPEQTEKIIPEIASIRSVDKDEAEQIIKEFESLVEKSRESGGVSTARNILEKAFGSKKADEMLEKAVPFKDGKPFEYLMEADYEKIMLLLKDESVAVRAMVLSQLNPKVSANVITNLPSDEKKEVVLRLAKMQKIDPEILKSVDQKMQEKFNSINIEKSDSVDGKNTLAQILKRMSPEFEEKILNDLSQQDSKLGSDLRELLFTQDDIINCDDKFMQSVLREMDDKDIEFLIADKDDSFRSKILQNVSANRANEILNEEKYSKPIKKSDVEKITSKFFSVLRRAWEDGKLIIKGRDDEVYV